MDSFSPFPPTDSPHIAPPSQLSLPPPPSVDPQEYPFLTLSSAAAAAFCFSTTPHGGLFQAAGLSSAFSRGVREREARTAAGAAPAAAAAGDDDDDDDDQARQQPSGGGGADHHQQQQATGGASIPQSVADSGCLVPKPNLQNIVSTVNLACSLDLKKIALQARNAEFNPKRFAAVIMRIRQPRTTALIFSSGKMVCTGAKSEEESRLAARKYARIVQKLGFKAKFVDFKIQNMVGSVDVQFPIRLEGLVLQHQQFCSYEPELFPGLIYRMIKPKIVLLIFVSGKVVLTGAKVREEIYEAFDNIYPILRGFKK